MTNLQQLADDAADPLALLTPDEVATLFRVKKSWVYDAAEAGRLPAIKLGHLLRFRRADLTDALDGLTSPHHIEGPARCTRPSPPRSPSAAGRTRASSTEENV